MAEIFPTFLHHHHFFFFSRDVRYAVLVWEGGHTRNNQETQSLH